MNKNEIIKAPRIDAPGTNGSEAPFFSDDPQGRRELEEYRKSRQALANEGRNLRDGKTGRYTTAKTVKQRDDRLMEEASLKGSQFEDMDIRSLALEAHRTIRDNGQTVLSDVLEDEIMKRIAEQAERNGWDTKKTDEALRYFIDIIYGEGRTSEPITKEKKLIELPEALGDNLEFDNAPSVGGDGVNTGRSVLAMNIGSPMAHIGDLGDSGSGWVAWDRPFDAEEWLQSRNGELDARDKQASDITLSALVSDSTSGSPSRSKSAGPTGRFSPLLSSPYDSDGSGEDEPKKRGVGARLRGFGREFMTGKKEAIARAVGLVALSATMLAVVSGGGDSDDNTAIPPSAPPVREAGIAATPTGSPIYEVISDTETDAIATSEAVDASSVPSPTVEGDEVLPSVEPTVAQAETSAPASTETVAPPVETSTVEPAEEPVSSQPTNVAATEVPTEDASSAGSAENDIEEGDAAASIGMPVNTVELGDGTGGSNSTPASSVIEAEPSQTATENAPQTLENLMMRVPVEAGDGITQVLAKILKQAGHTDSSPEQLFALYEELVTNPEIEIDEIFEGITLEYNQATGEYWIQGTGGVEAHLTEAAAELVQATLSSD